MSELGNDIALRMPDEAAFDLGDYYVLSEGDSSINDELVQENHEPKCRINESQNDPQEDELENQYRKQWDELYGAKINDDELRKRSLKGELRKSPFRSLYWRYMLGILHSEPKLWPLELRTLRTHYNDTWTELEPNPRNTETTLPDNPLSQEGESVWHKYFSNEELKSLIQQDVVRTFPGVEFFKGMRIQELMVKILFYYARQNPTLCYRQGMHEILAPLIFVLHCDHQAMLKAKEQNLTNEVLFEILDPKYLEEDAYSMFKTVMNHMESSYRIRNLISERNCFALQVADDDNRENDVITRLQYIKDNILQESDPDLNEHLDDLDIPLQIYGIRWLRLLFGREFPFSDLLVLWDAIFASSNFELVNYIVVAMLTAIRTILLAGDYSKCLINLTSYPSGVDVMFIIEYSLHLMSPSAYETPAVTSFNNEPVTLIQTARNLQGSENHNSLTGLSLKKKLVKPFSREKGTSGKSHLSGRTTCPAERDGYIVGSKINEANTLKSELEHQSSPLRYVQMKLSQYHKSLRESLPRSLSPEVKFALDGIYDLFTYLNTCDDYFKAIEVEPALEAKEEKELMSRNRNIKTLSKPVNGSEPEARIERKTKVKKQTIELKVIKPCKEYSKGELMVGIPKINPVRFIKAFSHDGTYDQNEVFDDQKRQYLVQILRS